MTEASAMDKAPLLNSNLPDYPAPTVTLYREQLARFRDDYGRMIEFAAFVLDVPKKSMCNLNFGTWLLAQDEEMQRRAPEWLREAALLLMAMRGDLDVGGEGNGGKSD